MKVLFLRDVKAEQRYGYVVRWYNRRVGNAIKWSIKKFQIKYRKGIFMTKYKVSLAVFFVLIAAIGCDSTNSDVRALPSGEYETRVYEVFGMDCPGCHGGVEKLIAKIPEVEKVEANWQDKQVAVVVREGAQLDDEQVWDAVRRSNFTPGKRIK
jgi:copper chaperone CopZ